MEANRKIDSQIAHFEEQRRANTFEKKKSKTDRSAVVFGRQESRHLLPRPIRVEPQQEQQPRKEILSYVIDDFG